jgi:hypothetical protein
MTRVTYRNAVALAKTVVIAMKGRRVSAQCLIMGRYTK